MPHHRCVALLVCCVDCGRPAAWHPFPRFFQKSGTVSNLFGGADPDVAKVFGRRAKFVMVASFGRFAVALIVGADPSKGYLVNPNRPTMTVTPVNAMFLTELKAALQPAGVRVTLLCMLFRLYFVTAVVLNVCSRDLVNST